MIQIDMPMPDNCLECRFNTSEFGYCNAMPVEFVGQVSDCEEDGKPEWCPLKAQEARTCSECRHYDTNAFTDMGGKCRNSLSSHYSYGCDKYFGCVAWEGK